MLNDDMYIRATRWGGCYECDEMIAPGDWISSSEELASYGEMVCGLCVSEWEEDYGVWSDDAD